MHTKCFEHFKTAGELQSRCAEPCRRMQNIPTALADFCTDFLIFFSVDTWD